MRHEMKLLVLQKLKFQNFTQPVFLLEYLYLNKTFAFFIQGPKKERKNIFNDYVVQSCKPWALFKVTLNVFTVFFHL